jgi:hypothetical protein
MTGIDKRYPRYLKEPEQPAQLQLKVAKGLWVFCLIHLSQ